MSTPRLPRSGSLQLLLFLYFSIICIGATGAAVGTDASQSDDIVAGATATTLTNTTILEQRAPQTIFLEQINKAYGELGKSWNKPFIYSLRFQRQKAKSPEQARAMNLADMTIDVTFCPESSKATFDQPSRKGPFLISWHCEFVQWAPQNCKFGPPGYPSAREWQWRAGRLRLLEPKHLNELDLVEAQARVSNARDIDPFFRSMYWTEAAVQFPAHGVTVPRSPQIDDEDDFEMVDLILPSQPFFEFYQPISDKPLHKVMVPTNLQRRPVFVLPVKLRSSPTS